MYVIAITIGVVGLVSTALIIRAINRLREDISTEIKRLGSVSAEIRAHSYSVSTEIQKLKKPPKPSK